MCKTLESYLLVASRVRKLGFHVPLGATFLGILCTKLSESCPLTGGVAVDDGTLTQKFLARNNKTLVGPKNNEVNCE
jgi:hypothetical protein